MKNNLQEILSSHKKWLNSHVDGVRAKLRGAYLEGANLRGANLRGANLRGANLRGANLRGAKLRGADLEGANLRGADLIGADLRDVDLRSANLIDANLRGVDLRYCIGNGIEIKSLQIGKYMVAYHKQNVCIGCQSHDLSKWLSFTDEEISEMDSEALWWWKLNKDIIKTLVEREK